MVDLPAPDGADDRDPFARRDRKADVVEHPSSGALG